MANVKFVMKHKTKIIENNFIFAILMNQATKHGLLITIFVAQDELSLVSILIKHECKLIYDLQLHNKNTNRGIQDSMQSARERILETMQVSLHKNNKQNFGDSNSCSQYLINLSCTRSICYEILQFAQYHL